MVRRRIFGAVAKSLMPTQISVIPWRKSLLILSGSLAVLYALTVLWYVYSMPDIGLRTAFDTSVKRFEGDSRPTLVGLDVEPKDEDRIVKLGKDAVRTWPQLLQALNALRQLPAEEVSSLADAE